MNVQKVIFGGSRPKINGFKDITGIRINTLGNNKAIHATTQMKYPLAKNLPLPNNVEAIMSIEIGQFSPLRSRDISGPVIYTKSHNHFDRNEPMFRQTFNQFVESYDCKGAVSLNASMQSNVPIPFQWNGNAMYLNMPGGQWEQGNKLIAEDMQKSHYLHVGNKKKKINPGIRMFYTATNNNSSARSTVLFDLMLRRLASTNGGPTSGLVEEKQQGKLLTKKQKFKRLVAEYGSTVIVFHIGISIISLGSCYVLVSSGLDMERLLSYIPFLDVSGSKLTQNASTFVTAYAIHKILMPIRISITLTAVPFIVRYLRTVGLLKKITN